MTLNSKNIRIGVLIPTESIVAVNFISKRIKVLEGVSDNTTIIRVSNKSIKLGNIRFLNTVARVLSYLYFELKTTYTFIKRSKDIDVLFFSITSGSLLLPQVVSKLLMKKNLYYTGGSTYECTKYGIGGHIFPFIAKMLEDINYRLCDGIITEGESQINQLRLEKYKNKVFPYGATYVDTDKLKITKPLKERENIVGFIGRLSKEKGIENFVDAIILLSKQNNDIEFIIGGIGPLQGYVIQRINEAGMQNRIRYIGWISHDDLSNYLNDIKLIVIPSYTEGLPNIMLEAMACGTPVLTTYIGAIPDVINDNINGFTIKNNIPTTIAEGIVRSINSPNIFNIADSAYNEIYADYLYSNALMRYKKIFEYLS